MNKLTAYSILAICCFSFACVDEPIPNFKVDPQLADVGQDVKITNNSFKAVRFEWDFGDSTTSTVRSPTKQYDSPGEYIITLLAFNKSEEFGTMKQTVTIGNRHLQLVSIKAIPDLDGTGNPWDTGDAADVQFAMRPVGSLTWSYESNINTDLATAVPYSLTVDPAVLLTDGSWEWELRDDDSGTVQIMASGTLSPYDVGGNQKIALTGNGYDIDLGYFAQ